MNGSSNSVAVRESAPSGALAIYADQVEWTPVQQAAFGQLGIADAPEGDKGVFLHVSQRTGLDPFSKQIYMIPRWDYQAKKNKYTIQTGIEGFRVMRARAERLEGVRGILSRPVYYDAEGTEHKVWVSRGVPVAVEMTYTVRDRNGIETPYTSILRFDEYRQTRKDGEQQVLSGQWATKPTHMLEKCTEADVYRKAFPQDFSGVQLDDAMPPPDPDAPSAQPQRQRVTAEQARARNPQTVTATVVTPDASPAGPESPGSAGPHPPAEPAGEVPVTREQVTALWACLTQDYGFGSTDAEKQEARAAVSILARRDEPVTSVNELTAAQASRVLDQLREWVRDAGQTGERPRDILAADIASRDAGGQEDGESGE